MHLVLRSSHAKGAWSLRRPKNFQETEKILQAFAQKHGVVLKKRVIHLNHIHLHVLLSSSRGYKRFIRAVSAAIAMRVTGMSRWNRLKIRFWDRRPFSRIVVGGREELALKDYLEINELETLGCSRQEARFYQAWEKGKRQDRERWRGASQA
jgi:REP element-mobilizing transposase RayT